MSRHATQGEGAAQALARLGELAAEWPQLSRLLDEALALAPAARAAWLRELPEEHAPLRATLARLLETRLQVESGDFLATLPKIDGASPVLADAADPAVPRAGDAVGPYRLVRELGEGGMGSVWLAERVDGLLKRPVALKLPRLTWVRGLAERLARERDILATLEHPNIARLYDAGLDAFGRPWLALEYVRGRPIDAHARDHALSVQQRLALLLQVCEAVTYAHGRRVIHRDIKPANILVTDDGQVRLLDFGIAKLMQQDDGAAAQTALTEATGHALTLAYASPEQVRGEVLTAASDLYSLGVVAYELLTGAGPYAVQSGRRAELQSAIERGELRPASEAATDARARRALRGELGAVLAMALARRPDQRYADVETLARELGRVLQGRPVLAPPRAAPAARAASIRFGAFTLQPGRQRLLADGEPVKLGSRAFDLLGVLVQHRDRVVPKSELQARVWPDQRVDAANLSGQVQVLRQVLGREAIVTVPGRGYRFVLPVAGDDPDEGLVPAGPAAGGPAQPRGHLPEAIEPLIGRARDRAALGRLVAAHRLVTLLGSGGVGKTRLAQAVAADLLPGFGDGAWWIALAPLADPERVPDAVAHALRLTLGGRADAARAVAGRLRDSRALLVLDNAEHLLGGVRALVGALGELAPSVHVLVTSQAPLQLPGEQRLRLAPLSLPDGSGVAACRSSDAVALFEARARSVDPSFTLDEATWEAAADVCRRLDGIPLAIELAAARLPLLGLEGLRQLLTAGSAAAPPRHQTLQAALSWSHGLLPAEAQRVFRRLGVFAGGCTLEAVQQVAVDTELGPWEVVEQLATLVDRSLVLAEGGASPRYRLLETARLFALERLREAGEEDRLRERHTRALDEWLTVRRQDARLWRTPPAPPEALVAELDNARAALTWAQDHADDALVLRLAAGASHVFLTAALNAEYLERVLPLRGRVRADTPTELAGRFWSRIAFAAGRNGHAAGLEAGHRAIAAWRALGDEGLLYDALTWTIAIGARQGRVEEAQALIEEGERIERDAWPPALRSSFRWAKHRWLQLQGRADEALACARQQAELLAQAGVWVMHVAWGANVADCEISLGRPAEAEAHARAALETLDGLGVDENIVGHVMDALVVALVQLGRGDEAMPVARRARRLLAREGDDLRLLEPLAAAAGARGQWDVAARLAGHADAAIAQSGETRWPSAVQRRTQLQEGLDRALPAAAQRELMRAGASMTREEAFAVALDDPPMPGKPAPR
jgi:predicted ATPase/DNA-binding winged helix-turn-helix (wHTH) protein